jgi:uncharacterized membrane protein YadS
VAVPMMIAMPWIAKKFQMPDLVAGAWLGGTLDTSASVVVAGGATKTDAGIIWERFPKFALGFLAASVLFSFFLPGDVVNGTMEGGRPALAFIAAQLVNVVWTLLLAYFLFGLVLFPLPSIS